MCIRDRSEAIGFIDIFSGETMTVGWNCLMEHGELRIPRIASGVVESRTDDDLETRERRGLQAFSIMAWDSDGKETLGVAKEPPPSLCGRNRLAITVSHGGIGSMPGHSLRSRLLLQCEER